MDHDGVLLRVGSGFAAALALLFLLGCVLTGFYTMVMYAASWAINWQKFLCPVI